MAKFNPNDYEDVAARLKRFKKDWPESRVVTRLISADGEVRATRWVVHSELYRDRDANFPDATGLASEIDGSGGANNTAALENCETSSIGRALANLGYHGDLRASREEMQKVQREEARQADLRDWGEKLLEFEKAGDRAKVQAGMDWAAKAGDQQKFHIAQGVLNRMPLVAEVVPDGPDAP